MVFTTDRLPGKKQILKSIRFKGSGDPKINYQTLHQNLAKCIPCDILAPGVLGLRGDGFVRAKV